MERHVVITGMPALGKTSVSAVLAEMLGRERRDSDADLDVLFGRTGAELTATAGSETLHEMEAAVLLGALAHPRPSVIAAAASVIDHRWCREALARCAHLVVLVGASRSVGGDHRRTIGDVNYRTLAEQRQPLWESHADLIVDVTGRDITDLATAIAVEFGRPAG